MRALVIAPQPFFTPRGTPLSVYHRTRIAAELGVEQDLLTYGEGEDVDIPNVRILRLPRLRLLEPIKVGPSYAKLLLDILMVFWTVALLLRRRYSFVHAHEEAAFFCTFLKPLFRFKLVYDMHSCLPQQLLNFGFTRSRLIIAIFKWLERMALASADAVITISPALASYALLRMRDPGRHILIENSLLDEVRLKRGPDGSAPRVPLEPLPAGRPIVAYAGTFESYQGIDLLLEAHASVVRERPDALLLLIGGSAESVRHHSEVAERLGILDHCRFTGVLTQTQARELLMGAALVVSPRTEGENTPLKIYELMASGVPLVATDVPSHTQVLNGDVCFLAPPEPEPLARALLQGLSNGEHGARVAAAAKERFARTYSREAYLERVSRLLDILA